MKWKDYARLLGIIVALTLAHHSRPLPTDAFLILLLVILIWLMIDWNFMSAEGRSALIAKFKSRHGIPQDQPHKVDEFLKE